MKKLVAVALAVMVLSLVGSFTGYVLGLRELHAREQAGQDPGGGDTAAPTVSTTPSGKPCLDFTERAAKQRFKSQGNLVQVLYIKTTGSEVWICRDTLGNLFYQGHRMSQAEIDGGPREPFVETNNLVLATVTHQPDGSWVATNTDNNGTTVYRVSATRLILEYPSGKQDTEKVLASEP